MAKISGGAVTFGRTVNLGDYNSKKAEVMLTFALDEGEAADAVIEEVAREVMTKCLAMVGVGAPAIPKTAPRPMTALADDGARAEAAEGVKEAAAAALTAKEKAEAKERAKAANTAKKPSLDIPESLKREPEKTAAPAKVEEDPGFDEDAAELPEVTQDQLTSAMNRKVAELKGAHGGAAPTMIKALIAKFVEPPKKSHDIPQNLRHDFLKKLEELK